MGKVDIFESNPILWDFALEDWMNKEKYKKKLQKMSNLDAKMYMDSVARAERAVEVALGEINLEAENIELE